MGIELTEEQLAVVFRYVARKMEEDNVPRSNTGEVVKWMILNPLPDLDELEADTKREDEIEKQRRIEILTKELARLEGN